MCFEERKMESRGRPRPARRTCRRTFSVRRLVRSATVAIGRSLLLLAFLAEYVFAGVFHALALVRLRLAERAYLGRYMSYFLPIDSAHHDFRRSWSDDRDALRDWIEDVMAITNLDLQVLALHGGPIADAADLQPTLESFGHARHHVRKQR